MLFKNIYFQKRLYTYVHKRCVRRFSSRVVKPEIHKWTRRVTARYENVEWRAKTSFSDGDFWSTFFAWTAFIIHTNICRSFDRNAFHSYDFVSTDVLSPHVQTRRVRGPFAIRPRDITNTTTDANDDEKSSFSAIFDRYISPTRTFRFICSISYCSRSCDVVVNIDYIGRTSGFQYDDIILDQRTRKLNTPSDI